ncbi:MAG: hypothetical protein R6V51_01355, partial [Dehalococcoidia bacterium]
RKYPEIVPPLEKQQLMWAGTGFHKTFGSAVSSEEYLEQFVEAEGVVGKIDIYDSIPVEVKTTSRPVDAENLLQQRPTYVEQLGMYCAMVNKHDGEIIVYQRQVDDPSSASPLLVYHVTFPDLEAVRSEMRRRRDLLLEALTSNDPGNLPACVWFNRQCDYSRVCDCKTTSQKAAHEIAALASEMYVDSTTCQQLLRKMAQPHPSQVFRINDVVFPRKAFFERMKAREAAQAGEVSEEKGEYLRSMDERGFLDALRDSLRYGAPGEAQRVPVRHTSLADLVQIWQNMPTILRDPRFSSLVERVRLPRAFPHYFLRLAFECALTDHSRGRLLIYYVKVPKEDAKLMVYDVTFRNLDAIRAEAVRRVDLLEKGRTALELPKCPSWLCSYCDYRVECGEG